MKPLTTILIIIVAVLATWMASIYFGKVEKTEEMIRADERGKVYQERYIADSIEHIKELAEKDSIIDDIKEMIAASTPKLIQSKNETKKIPVIINSLSNNELLNRANSFTPRQ